MQLVSLLVSIHALVWRATSDFYRLERASVVSIHALVWRATPVQILPGHRQLRFNPRPRMEGDGSCVTTCGISVNRVLVANQL